MNPQSLKVLMVSTDRNLLVEGSPVSKQHIEWYGPIVEELHIVLMSDRGHGLSPRQISKNIWVYPTNSASKFFRMFDAARIGKRIIFDRKFVRGRSIVTTQDPFECGWAGVSMKRRWRIPLEVQLHTDPSSPYFGGFLNALRKRLAKGVFKQADTVRVVSGSIKNSVVAMYGVNPSRISVLPVCIDIKSQENKKASFDVQARYGFGFSLLCVARLAPEKNLGMAIEVLAKIRNYFPKAGLIIVGDGPERHELERRAAALGVSGAVVFTGWQDDTASFYATSNLFLQTSWFEGYGMALVEAGLAGLPIVTTPVGIATELKDGTDLILCPPGDADYMFKAVYDLVADNMKREMLRSHIRKALEAALISEDQYREQVQRNWLATAQSVHA